MTCACICHLKNFDNNAALDVMARLVNTAMYPPPTVLADTDTLDVCTTTISELMGNGDVINAPVTAGIVHQIAIDVFWPFMARQSTPEHCGHLDDITTEDRATNWGHWLHEVQHQLMPFLHELSEWAQQSPVDDQIDNQTRHDLAIHLMYTAEKLHAGCYSQIELGDNITNVLNAALGGDLGPEMGNGPK